MQTLDQIQKDVGHWARANFGLNETDLMATTNRGMVCLDEYAPLMGIVEEVGELTEAFALTGDPAKAKANMRDAAGDIMIYLCDYCWRCDLVVPGRVVLDRDEIDHEPHHGIVAAVGRLHNAHLKRFQGIKGMASHNNFDPARARAVHRLVYYLDKFIREYIPGDNLMLILNETWNTIVKKRNWLKDPMAGGGHDHHGTPGQDGP